MVSARSIKPIQRLHFTFKICRTAITIILTARHERSMNGQLQVQPWRTICRLHQGSLPHQSYAYNSMASQRHVSRLLSFTIIHSFSSQSDRPFFRLPVCLFVCHCLYNLISAMVGQSSLLPVNVLFTSSTPPLSNLAMLPFWHLFTSSLSFSSDSVHITHHFLLYLPPLSSFSSFFLLFLSPLFPLPPRSLSP